MMDDRIDVGRGKVAAVVRVMAVVTVGVKEVGRAGKETGWEGGGWAITHAGSAIKY